MWRRIALFAVCLSLAVVTQAQTSLTATYGTPVDLTIESDLPQLIAFEGKVGDTVYVSQFSETVDIPMTLFAPDGTQLATSVTFQQQTIAPVALPVDGTYTVSVQRPDFDDNTGTARILIETTPLTTLTETPITGTFARPGQMVWFTAEATAGSLYRMESRCANCSFFEILPSQDVIGLTYTQRDPLWILDLWEDNGRALFGSYTSTASDYSFALIPVTPIPLAQGVPAEGTIRNNSFETFVFNSAANKAWRLDATMSDQGDRIIRLFQFQDRPPWDSLLLADSGSGPQGNPQITPFIAPIDASYYVVLEWRGYRVEDAGSPYTVTLRPESLRQLTPDGVAYQAELTGTDGTERYLYRGTAGETLTLTLRKTAGEGQPFIRVVGPTDEAVVFYGRAATRLVVDLTLPDDGLYQIAVSNISYDPTSTLSYDIALETLPAP